MTDNPEHLGRRNASSHSPVAVITGGTLGIGEQISKQLLDLGWNVHVLARRASKSPVSSQVGCFAHDVDVRDYATIQATAHKVSSLERHSPIDALVLCAGVGYEVSVPKLTPRVYAELFDTNVGGLIFSTQAFLPILRDGRAVIAAISSIAGRRGFAGWSAYCASKHAVEGFLSSLRDEVRSRGIRVTSIQPGSVDTPSYDHLPPEAKRDFMSPETIAALTVQTLLLPPEAVVEVVFVNNSAGDL